MLKVIYEPKGRAREFGKLACNIYLRCTHSCLYCYCPQALHIPRNEFFKTSIQRPNFLKKLEEDASELQGKGNKKKVFLSFIGDCYQPINAEFQLARQAIEVLHFYGQNVAILTKGGYRALPDLPLLKDGDQFAVTLTCLDEALSLKWEPGAALPQERIDTLKEAYARGVYTWVSLEPVLYPEQSLALIEETHEFVNQYKLGILNHHEHARTIDWADYGHRAISLIRKYWKEYYIKDDLKRYIANHY